MFSLRHKGPRAPSSLQSPPSGWVRSEDGGVLPVWLPKVRHPILEFEVRLGWARSCDGCRDGAVPGVPLHSGLFSYGMVAGIRHDWRLNPAPMLERVRARAYPGRDAAEVNAVLLRLRMLLQRDETMRSRPPTTLPVLGA